MSSVSDVNVCVCVFSQVPKDVMLTCFPSVTMDTVVGVASNSMLHIAQYLQSSTHTSHR